MWLNVLRGNGGAEQQTPPVARYAEANHAGLTDRSNHNHLSATTPDIFERRHNAWMIACRIAPNHKHQISVLHVI